MRRSSVARGVGAELLQHLELRDQADELLLLRVEAVLALRLLLLLFLLLLLPLLLAALAFVLERLQQFFAAAFDVTLHQRREVADVRGAASQPPRHLAQVVQVGLQHGAVDQVALVGERRDQEADLASELLFFLAELVHLAAHRARQSFGGGGLLCREGLLRDRALLVEERDQLVAHAEQQLFLAEILVAVLLLLELLGGLFELLPRLFLLALRLLFVAFLHRLLRLARRFGGLLHRSLRGLVLAFLQLLGQANDVLGQLLLGRRLLLQLFLLRLGHRPVLLHRVHRLLQLFAGLLLLAGSAGLLA